MHRERGQATLEWTALLLVVAAVLATVATFAVATNAPGLVRSLRCAIFAGCGPEDDELTASYGPDVAAFVRWWAPNFAYERGTLTLPVDFRTCRRHSCADASGKGDTDVWRSSPGERQATVFSHAVDRRAAGGDLFVQYWLYYPDSTYNGVAYHASRAIPGFLQWTPAARAIKAAAGHHGDDWESYQVRMDARGRVFARASAHNGYSARKRWPNHNELPDWLPIAKTGAWTSSTGWTHVSRGSHAGYIVDGPGGGRRTEANGVAVVPIESLSGADRARPFPIVPPWRKPVFRSPTRGDT